LALKGEALNSFWATWKFLFPNSSKGTLNYIGRLGTTETQKNFGPRNIFQGTVPFKKLGKRPIGVLPFQPGLGTGFKLPGG